MIDGETDKANEQSPKEEAENKILFKIYFETTLNCVSVSTLFKNTLGFRTYFCQL